MWQNLALRSYFGRLEKKTCLCNWAFVASFLGEADASSTFFYLLQALIKVTKRKSCFRPAFRLTVAHRKGSQAEGFAVAWAMLHWRALSQKTVSRRFAKLQANLHWTAVNVIAEIAMNRNNNWRPAPAKGLMKSCCVIDPFTQLDTDRLLPTFFDNATLKVKLTSQRRGLWKGTKKIITQAKRWLKEAAANDGNEPSSCLHKAPHDLVRRVCLSNAEAYKHEWGIAGKLSSCPFDSCKPRCDTEHTIDAALLKACKGHVNGDPGLNQTSARPIYMYTGQDHGDSPWKAGFQKILSDVGKPSSSRTNPSFPL